MLGINIGQFEVALNSTTSTTSKLASVSFAGFTLGNIILSTPVEKIGLQINLQMIYISCVLILSSCSFLLPYIVSDFYSLAATIMVNGVSGGIIQAASIARVLVLWGHDSAVFLQMLDFAYSVGSIVGPFVCQPFLVDVVKNSSESHEISSTLRNYTAEDLMIVYPYSIIGVISAIVFIASCMACLKETTDTPHPSRGTNRHQERDMKDHVTISGSITAWKSLVMVLLASLTYAFTNGMLNIESIFWTKYVSESEFKLPSSTGASMLGTSWVVHVVSVAVFAGVIKAIGVSSSLFLGVTLILLSNLLLVVSTTAFSMYNPFLAWTAVIGMSVGGSTFFGPLVAFMEMHFPVSARYSSFYLIPNCIANIVWPIIVGQFFESMPNFVIYSMTFCAFVSTLLVFIIVIFAEKVFANKTRQNVQ